jgi:hypothetical protein
MTLSVIGAGFGRTGTHALKLALEQLGFGPCHHMFEVRDRPEQLPLWQAAARGEAVDWDAVFSGYRAQVDWPGARYWRELATHYPQAKVVLTVRPEADWYDSVRQTIYLFMTEARSHRSPQLRGLAEMAYQTIVQQVFGGRLDDRSHAIAVFRRHIADVQTAIPSHRLLTFSVSEGWEPLCGFLGMPIPAGPFPRTNPRDEFPKPRSTTKA